MTPDAPTGATSAAATAGPASAPALPPAETRPKSRRPCSLVKRSDMKLQKTLVTNRL